MRRYAAVAFTLLAVAVHHRPTIAQSGSGFDTARTSFTSVREYVAAEAVPARIGPPWNVIVSDEHRALIEEMLRLSPTFRRQCARIAAERRVLVTISITPPASRSSLRALTFITLQPNGRVTASIEIGFLHNTVELISHEFEHIIEQLDGVDLAARALVPRSGVHESRETPGVYETERATRVGRRVDAEVREQRTRGPV